MRSDVIDCLTAFDPVHGTGVTLQRLAADGNNRGTMFREAEINFTNRYAMPDLGWVMAMQYANHKKRLPVLLTGRDEWVLRAYLMFLNPHKFRNEHIQNAFSIWKKSSRGGTTIGVKRGGTATGAMLKSLLLTCASNERLKREDPDKHIKDIAENTGLPEQTVEAFEQLFYNMFDRADDAAFYHASEAYPETRLIELREDYAETTSFVDLMKRAGYNEGDVDMLYWMAGVGDKTYLAKVAAAEDNESKLTKLLITNAMILARTGSINARSPGLSRSTALLNAARQAGGTAEDPPITGAYPPLSKAFAEAAKSAAAVKRDTMHKLHGR